MTVIFDLDGTLADCRHRKHFVEASKNPDYYQVIHGEGRLKNSFFYHKETKEKFVPDWEAFYEACDKDDVINPVMGTFSRFWIGEKPRSVEIWSGRCESVRKKTEDWLKCHVGNFSSNQLKMRPIGDNTPDDELKEKWLDERIDDIEFVFDDRPKVIRMWQKRGIFVFNCNQTNEEF